MKITRVEYEVENNCPVVYLFQRIDGKRVIEKRNDHVPYFYVMETEKDKLKGIRQDGGYTAIDGTQLVRIYTTLPSDVPQLRDKYSKYWEADVLYPIRYQIDMIDELEPCDLKPLFIDIETDNSGRVPNPTVADESILCVTCFIDELYTTFIYRHDFSPGTSHKVFWDILHETRYFTNEVDMLQALVDYIAHAEPDVISGWYSNRFDLPYIINRMRRLGINYNRLSPMGKVYIDDKYNQITIKGVNIIDLYDAYRHFTEGMEESYKLDYIGTKVVGVGKVGSAANVKWMWKYSPDELINYNATDTHILVELDKKLMLLDFLDELRRMCFCQMEDCLSMGKMADSYILKMFHGRKVFPTKSKHEKYSYEGAFVGTWAKGIYNNVAQLDMKSMYPSLICEFNISPDTLISIPTENSICIGNSYFRQDIKGFLTEVINNLFEERAKYRTLMSKEKVGSSEWNLYNMRQKAIKTLLNALYGQTAYVGSRIHSPKVAEAITYLGRNLIIWSKQFLENLGYKALYCDTDSVFVQLLSDEINFDEINDILALLNDSYEDFIRQHHGG